MKKYYQACDGWTEGQTNGRYQTSHLPACSVRQHIESLNSSLFITLGTHTNIFKCNIVGLEVCTLLEYPLTDSNLLNKVWIVFIYNVTIVSNYVIYIYPGGICTAWLPLLDHTC